MGCEALATKAELIALEAKISSQLNQKASKSELPSLIKAILAGAGFATVGQVQMLGNQVDFLKNKIPTVEQLASKAYSRTNFLAQQTTDALGRSSVAVAQAQAAANKIPGLINLALAALSIGTLAKSFIDQKADQIQMRRLESEIQASNQANKNAFNQAIRARQEARGVEASARAAIEAANRATATTNQAIALSNRESAANAFAQEAARKANAAAANAQAQAKAIAQAANNSIKNLQAQVKQTEEAYQRDITRLKIEQTIARAEQLKKTQQEIDRVRIEQTVQRFEQLKQIDSLNQRQTEVETNVRTTLKGVTTEIKQIAPLKTTAIQLQSTVDQGLKTTAKQLESSLNQTVTEQVKAANTQVVTQIQAQTQQQIKTQIEQVQQQNIKMNEEQFQKIDTKLTNVLATAGIAATVATIAPQILEKVSKITPAPCLAPALVPPVGAAVNTNIGLTNTLQGVVVAQNAVLQGTANAINATVQATNGIVRAMQPVLNTVKSGLDTLSNFTQQAWDTLKIDKALAVMNFIMTTHNAMMLSRNLAQTFGDVSSSLLNAIGVKNPIDGSPIDVNEIVGNAIKNSIQAAIGEETYTNLASGFNRANRILQATQGIIWAIRSMKDAALEASEVIGGWVAKIGNGMLTQGLFEDRLFPWMDENPQFKNHYRKYHEKVDDYEQALSEVSQLISASTEFTQAIQETTEAVTTMHQAVGEFDNSKEATEATAKTNSQQPTTSNSDLNKSEETTP